MTRKKKHPQADTRGTSTTPSPTDQAEAPITKKEAVRRALAEGKATAATGIPFIKVRFGLDLKPQQYSAYKGELGERKNKAKKKPGRQGPRPEAVAVVVTEVLPMRQRGGGIDLDTVRQVKELCGRYGADTVRRLVSLLGK